MAVVIRVKRRSSGAAGAPTDLENAEMAYNEVGDVLYYGKGTGGQGGKATVAQAIAGPGAFVDRSTGQSIDGVKSFNSSPTVPTAPFNDSSSKAASTEFVAKAIAPTPQAPNSVYAGPASGSTAANPTFRNLQPADLPIHTSDKISDFSSAADARITAQKGQAGGLVPLDANKLIPSVYLPSFVDDVLEFANLAAFPATGETGKMYVALDSNKTYRFGGTSYIEISASPGSTDAVPEGSVNRYFTEPRVLATALAGLAAATGVPIAAADSVLNAFAKLQAQVSARLVAASNLSDLTDKAAARTNLGLGSMAVQNSNNVNITGGLIDGITFDGGTF